MSVERSVICRCDGCGEVVSAGDHGALTAAEARSEARRYSGAHTSLPGGRDVCPVCWDEGVR